MKEEREGSSEAGRDQTLGQEWQKTKGERKREREKKKETEGEQ